MLEAIAAGQLDAGCGSQIPPIFASLAVGGGNFKIIAIRKGTTLNQELIVSPQQKDKIKTVADLKGKKVGYVKNTTAQYFLYKMLTEAGLAWNDIEAIPMSTSDGLSAITTGDIDALASYDNAVIVGKAKGAALLRSAEDILSGDYYWYAALDTIKDPMCNPKAQAQYLNEHGVELFISAGLCVGHDALFSKAANGPVTTLVVKDRVLGNNPMSVVYSGYWLKKLGLS